MSKMMSWWINRSTFVKTLCTQIVLILFPVIICLMIFANYIYLDFLSSSARTSYQYSRYALDSFESQMLQIKAVANIVLTNRRVINFLTSNTAENESDLMERASSSISSVTSARNVIKKATLFSTNHSGRIAGEYLPMWHEDVIQEEQIKSGWRYVVGENPGDFSVCWIQAAYMDEKPVGVLNIQLHEQELIGTVTSIADIIGGNSIICSRDGRVIYAQEQGVPINSERLKTMLSYAEGYHTLNHYDFVNVLYCNAMDLVFLTMGTVSSSMDSIKSQGISFLFVFVILGCLAAFTMWLQNIGVTQRIKLLSRQIKQVDSLNFLRPITNVEGDDEIGVLARNFNVMLERIVELANRERKAHMLQQVAKFNALQAQIQPHFLYNTLETLRMMADEHDDQEVADMLFVLGKLMRNSISGKVQNITLNREIENIENYLKLNKLRFNNLHFEVNCEMDVSELTCPRFILQPLVENCIHHGISRMRKDGYIELRIYRMNEFCQIDVCDNGPGISPERLESIRKALDEGIPLQQDQGGIGIVNVHTRLKMFYGPASGLEISSDPGIKTMCRIKIELKEKGNV